MFLVLGGILWTTAVFAGTNSAFGSLAEWFTGAVLIIFAFVGRSLMAPQPARIRHAA